MDFVTDAHSEAALREGLLDALPKGIETRRADIWAAIAALQKIPTLRALVVDISGEEQPIAALAQLSEVVEPDTCVLVVGDADNVGLYREITRGLGAAEYLAKPLTRDLVSRYFSPLIRGQAPSRAGLRGGPRVGRVPGAAPGPHRVLGAAEAGAVDRQRHGGRGLQDGDRQAAEADRGERWKHRRVEHYRLITERTGARTEV